MSAEPALGDRGVGGWRTVPKPQVTGLTGFSRMSSKICKRLSVWELFLLGTFFLTLTKNRQVIYDQLSWISGAHRSSDMPTHKVVNRLLLTSNVDLYQTEVSKLMSFTGPVDLSSCYRPTRGPHTFVHCTRMRQLCGHNIDIWNFKNMRRSS